MTTILLIKLLQNRIQQLLGDDIKVHLFDLPKRKSDEVKAEKKRFPFVIITPHKGSDTDEGSVHICFLFGAQGEEYTDGAMDVFHMMEQVRYELLKKRAMDFARLESYDWEFYEDQPAPEWFGEARMRWLIPTIIEEVQGI